MAAENREETGLWAGRRLVMGCHSTGQEAQSRATQHSAVPALSSGSLHHNLHPNPGATAGGTSPPTVTCLARPYTSPH